MNEAKQSEVKDTSMETDNEVLARRLLDMFSLEELLETMEITEEALVKWLLDENHLNQVTLDELGVKDD